MMRLIARAFRCAHLSTAPVQIAAFYLNTTTAVRRWGCSCGEKVNGSTTVIRGMRRNFLILPLIPMSCATLLRIPHIHKT